MYSTLEVSDADTETLKGASWPGSITLSVTIPDLYWNVDPSTKEESEDIKFE